MDPARQRAAICRYYRFPAAFRKSHVLGGSVHDAQRQNVRTASSEQVRQPRFSALPPPAECYSGTSINLGPSLSNPSVTAFANSPSDDTLLPGTPIPFASFTQSRSPTSNMLAEGQPVRA